MKDGSTDSDLLVSALAQRRRVELSGSMTVMRSRPGSARLVELQAGRPGSSLARTLSSGDERARELYVRGLGLLGGNDRRGIEAAQALLDRAVCWDPRFARAMAARGYTRWRQYFAGWTPNSDAALVGALRDVDAALNVDPDSVGAHMTFIRACWDMGWHERALEAGRSIYTRNPESLDATLAFARALMNAGLAQNAMPLVGSVLAEDPTNPAAIKLTIWCLLMLGEHRRVLDVACDYLPDNPADANTRWAVALASQHTAGGEAHGIRIAREALQADPGDVTVWVLLGYLYRLAGHEASARKAWAAGLARMWDQAPDQSNHRVKAWIANLHAGVGDRASALCVVDELTEADPTNGYLRYRLFHVLAELGEDAAALRMLESAVSCGFLSVQLLRQEEIFAPCRLGHRNDYVSVVRRLDADVERCRRTHATRLPTAVAGTNREGTTR